MTAGSSDWATTASAMPVALALCSEMLNPAAKAGAAGMVTIAASAASTASTAMPGALKLKAPRLRIPWILLAIESVDGSRPPQGAGRGLLEIGDIG